MRCFAAHYHIQQIALQSFKHMRTHSRYKVETLNVYYVSSVTYVFRKEEMCYLRMQRQCVKCNRCLTFTVPPI